MKPLFPPLQKKTLKSRQNGFVHFRKTTATSTTTTAPTTATLKTTFPWTVSTVDRLDQYAELFVAL